MRKVMARALAIILSISLLYNGSFTSYAQESVSGSDAQVTEVSETVASVEPTATPEQTQAPEATEEPEQTQAPEATEEPEQTQTPEATEEPEQTQTPEVTELPEQAGDVVSVSGGDAQPEPVMMFAMRPTQKTYDVTVKFTDSAYKSIYSSIELDDVTGIDYDAVKELYDQDDEKDRPYTIAGVSYLTTEKQVYWIWEENVETKKAITSFDGTLLEDYVYNDKITLYVVLSPKSADSIEQPVTFYDYESSPSKLDGTINDPKNYPSGSKNSKRIGTNEANGTYNGKLNNVGVNNYNGSKITPGIVKELTGTNYTQVVVADGFYEPGFFSTEEKIGKTIYTDYILIFKQTGNAYEMVKVLDGSGAVAEDTLVNNFFPMDSVGKGNNHNEYFAMRYDFEFTIGDYIGDMIYDFSGDDDLWVFLDGKRIIDVGGIHDTLQRDADLWQVLAAECGYTGDVSTPEGRDAFMTAHPAQKEIEHTISVLYMERGGNLSTCKMSFVMPQFTQKPVVTLPTSASFAFGKTSDTGEALSGAQFKLYDGEEEKYTATSAEDGKVSFADVEFGTYTMKETQAPEGYKLLTNAWTVEVSKDAVTIDGKDASEVTIVNSRKLSEVLAVSKTAKLVNEQDRTYELTLTAQSLLERTQTNTITKPVDVVMVMDVSSSMKGDKLKHLKTAVCDLIDATVDGSRVALVKFGGGAEIISGDKSAKGAFVEVTESGKQSLKSIVDGMNTWRGTYYVSALEQTVSVLENRTGDNPCYVIFASDGEPSNQITYNGKTYSDKKKAIYAGADDVKEKAVMYTIGIGVGDDEEELLTEMSTDEKYYGADSSASNIGKVLEGITEEVQSSEFSSIQNATVVDYIDPRFEVVTEQTQDYTIGSDENGTYVSWSAQELLPQEAGGWTKTIMVKAKDDFLGGDAVPTNGGKSGVTVDGETVLFPIPEVDVRLLDLNLSDGETTIFIEDEIIPLAYWTDVMEDTLTATYKDSNAATPDIVTAIGKLSETDAAMLFETGTCTVPYSYEGMRFGNLVYKVENETTQGAIGSHVAKAVGEAYETYKVTVSYEATQALARDVELNNEKETACSAPYVVNVIAGQLTITKKISARDTDLTQGDPIFQFKITKDGEDYMYKTVRFSSKTDAEESVVIDMLPRGEYEVTELTTMRYECTDGKDGKSATISLENIRDEVTFKNEKINKKNFSDTDVVVNTCGFDNNGKLVWSGSKLK